MENYCLVRPEHLNHFGYLFGGQMLKWIDEYAWMAASKDFPGMMLVTRAMDRVEFQSRVRSGSILRFVISKDEQRITSVTYTVHVYASEPNRHEELQVFSTKVTFVAVDESGKKKQLPKS